MRGERDKDVESLASAYGIGRRLATRVAALRAKKLDLTGTLLAEAARDEALGRLLLSSELLREAESLTEARLQTMAAQGSVAASGSLRVVAGDEAGWRTMALEDDVLAQEAQRQSGMQAAREVSLVRAVPQQISARETEGLFTPEEVARLKLAALTSQNAEQRVEALRKLVFAPMDGAQKAGIFLNVLIDREAEARVRREAVGSLELIGFRSDMADAVRGLFQDEPVEAVQSIQRLGALLREAEEGEAALVLAVVLEVFDQSKDAAILRELLRLTSSSIPLLVGNYQRTEQLFQAMARHLARDFDSLRPEVEATIRACIQEAPDVAADLIRLELRRAVDPRVRSLLLNLGESLAREPAQAAELAEMAVQEILNAALPESEKARLRYGLVRLGEPAVLVALRRLGQASGTERSELIRLVDVLCTESDVTDATVQTAVTVLLDLLKVADSVTRRSILDVSLLGDRRISRSLQEGLAGELLTLMVEFNLPGTLDAIQNTLERIGAPALRPACAFMRRNYPSEPARRAALVIGQVVQNQPGEVSDETAGDILRLCLALLKDESIEQGAFTIALASVCGYTRRGAEQFEGSLRELKDGLWRRPYPMDALEALGIMAGSDNAKPEHQRELFELFDGIVRYQARAGLGVRRETEAGTVYEFGREVEFDVRAVPAAVKGLERICLSRQAPQEMRREIVKRLLILWEGVSKVRIIWGPAAIEALVGAMRTAACAPTATPDTKVRLAVSLLRFLNKLSVIRSLGEICSQPDRDPGAQKLAVQAGTEVLDAWEACEMQDVERRLALLRTAGRIAANPALNARAEAVRRLRERTLQALFSGLREGMHEAREPLLLLRECPDLPAAQKREIDERVSKAFALVRVRTAR
jgi:hypothetical protein